MNKLARTAVVIASLLVGFTLAASPIRIDDSGVDFSNTDLSTAYLGLEEQNGEITVVLADASSADTVLPIELTNVPVKKDTNMFGTTTYEGLLTESTGTLQLDMTGNLVYGISVKHDDVTLANAISAYQAGLERIGQQQVAVEMDGDYAVITTAEGTRIVLQNVFDGVLAHIAG